MLTRSILIEVYNELKRALESGDPMEQRRGASLLPLAEFAVWAHEAIEFLIAGDSEKIERLPDGDLSTDPANIAHDAASAETKQEE